MSGIYITVWDNNKEFDRILKPTKGGWPHVTLAWTGKNLSHSQLKSLAQATSDFWLMSPLTLKHAHVNTFFSEKDQKDRYDVLVSIEEAEQVEKFRNLYIRSAFDCYKKFNMMEPHVTTKICWTREEAEQECERINKLLPVVVTVNGVTID